MTPNQVKTYLKSAMAYCVTLAESGNAHARDYPRPLIIGALGIGKTTVCDEASAEMGFSNYVLNMARADEVNFTGRPDTRDTGDTMKWLRPEHMPATGQRRNVTMDEIAQSGHRNIFNLGANFQYDRMSGEHPVSAFTLIMATANPADIRANSTEMPNNYLTRVEQIQMVADLGEFIAHARKHNLDERILAFLAHKGLPALIDFDANRAGVIKANANPRTWFAAGRKLELKLPRAIEMEVIAGLVGAKLMGELYGFMNLRHDIVSPQEVFARPDKTALPGNANLFYALITAMIPATEYKNVPAAVQYLERANAREFLMFYINGLVSRDSTRKTGEKFGAHPDISRVLLASVDAQANA